MNDKNLVDWRYQSSLPIFGPCTITLEEGDVRDATNTEIFECCTRRCNPKYDFCKKLCNDSLEDIYITEKPDRIKCLRNCVITNNLCLQECQGMVPQIGLDNYYYNCAKTQGCAMDYGQKPEVLCVDDKKDSIMDCCKKKCKEDSNDDCDNLCQTLENTLLHPTKLGIPIDMYPNVHAANIKKVEKHQDNIFLVLGIFAYIILVVFLVYLVLKK